MKSNSLLFRAFQNLAATFRSERLKGLNPMHSRVDGRTPAWCGFRTRYTATPRWRLMLLGILVGSLLPIPVRSSTFSSGANGAVNCFALQPDGKIIVAGSFTTLSGQPCTNLGRLNRDGALDLTFNANAPDRITTLIVQPDGKLIVGGWFGTLGGRACRALGRLERDGSFDSTFDAAVDPHGSVDCVALQPDGKVLVGGHFTVLGGQPCDGLGRINSDGSLDPTFNTTVQGQINCLALQPDGKLLVGGFFNLLDGQSCTNLGRLNSDGTLDSTFLSALRGVDSVAVQPDGKILAGWMFNVSRLMSDGTFDPTFEQYSAPFDLVPPLMIAAIQTDGKIIVLAGNRLIRLNADGTQDTSFVNEANGSIQSVALQPDGEVLLGGRFGLLNGQPRQCLGSIENTGPANQTLSFDGSTITWLRSGPGPDFWRVSFEGSTNGVDWSDLGAGTPVTGGWQLAAVSFPTNGNIRARGFVVAPTDNFLSKGNAAWMAESYLGAPLTISQPAALVYSTGSTANLSAGVAGTEPLRYQWFFDGALLSGATNALLILTNIQSSQAGQYAVIATNVYGAITNDIGTLAVTAPPVIPQILLQGQQLTNGLMQFTWNTVYGLNYEIQYSTNPNGPAWQFFNGPVTNHSFLSGGYSFSHRSTDESLIITSCGSTLTFTDPSPADTNRFYRVRYAQ